MKKHLLFLVLVLGSCGAMAQAFGWTELGHLNATSPVHSLCTDGAGDVFAAIVSDTGYYYVSGWNGVQWDKVGNRDFYGFQIGTVHSNLCSENSGNVYAPFYVQSDSTWHIAKFLSVSWENLPGLKIPGHLFEAYLVSTCTDNLGNLYASGDIRDYTDNEFILEWNGINWIEHQIPLLLYVGMINSICSTGGGYFFCSEYNGGAGMSLLEWNGIGWSQTDTLSRFYFRELCGGALGHVYAIGDFKNSLGFPYVAEWNGISWSEVGGSNGLKPNGPINSICTDVFGNVYAAGDFTNSSGYNYVAKWDGMSWRELGDSIHPLNANGQIFSICADVTGNVYVAGNFTDSTGFRYVAKCAKIDQVKWIRESSHTQHKLTTIYFPQSNKTLDNRESSSNLGYAAGENGTILKTNDSGLNWEPLSSGTTNSLYSVCFPTALLGYAVGESGTIIKTIDGGEAWTVQSSGTNVQLNSVFFIDTLTGYATGALGKIIKTDNGGITWNLLNSGSTDSLYSVYFTNVNSGYIVGTAGKILKTEDAGSTWIVQSSGTNNTLHSVHFLNDSVGFTVGDYGTILKTTNGGTNWTAHNTALTKFCRFVFFTDTDNGYIVGSNGTILKTTNGGTNWMVQNSGTSQNLSSVFFTTPSIGYAVGDSGTIIGTTTGSIGGIKVLTKEENPLKIYPNPSFEKITIETSIILLPGELSIFNLNGQKLITYQISGPKTLIDITALPLGMYFINVTNNKSMFNGKFIRE